MADRNIYSVEVQYGRDYKFETKFTPVRKVAERIHTKFLGDYAKGGITWTEGDETYFIPAHEVNKISILQAVTYCA